jgi:hypothetical protein
MTFDEFSKLTRRVVAHEGLDNYQPTVCFPARREIRVMTGLPADCDIEATLLSWATRTVQHLEEFVIAFRLDAERLKIVRRVGPYEEGDIYSMAS